MGGRTIKAPFCAHCRRPAELVSGVDVYPHRQDLGAASFWRCSPCPAWVGCHGTTKRPLGSPANTQLRDARIKLHQRIDPIWKTALVTVDYEPEDPKARMIILNTARSRVYQYLAWRLGLDKEDCHVAMFDLETCRRAWVALRGAEYPAIRDWAKARKAKEAA